MRGAEDMDISWFGYTWIQGFVADLTIDQECVILNT
jgi:hypothetical protein